jgi:hypothetical protein
MTKKTDRPDGAVRLSCVREDIALRQDRQHSGPRCFMHIPKSGGESIHTALEAALLPGSLAPQRFDKSVFCEFTNFDCLRPETRAEIVCMRDEVKALAGYKVVSGHFSLDTLTEFADMSSVATILREPRARLLSLYLYWRIPDIYERWNPYRADRHAMRPLREFLSEPYLAAVTDNQICRMLVPGDPRIPVSGFIKREDVCVVAKAASERLAELGFVGFLEVGNDAWDGLSRLFNVRLERVKVNVTGEGPAPIRTKPGETLLTAEVFELIEARNAADRIVYQEALLTAGLDDSQCKQIADGSFNQQQEKLSDLLECS